MDTPGKIPMLAMLAMPPTCSRLLPYQSPRSSRHRGGDHQTFERWMMDFHLPKLGDGLSIEKTAATELKLSPALSPRSPRLGDVLAGIVGGGWQTHLRGHENKNLWEPTLGTTGRPGSSKRKSSCFVESNTTSAACFNSPWALGI